MPVETDCQDYRLRRRPLIAAMMDGEIALARHPVRAGILSGQSRERLSGRKVPF